MTAAAATDDTTTAAETKTVEQPVADIAIASTGPFTEIKASRKELAKEEPAKEESVKEDELNKDSSVANPAAGDRMVGEIQSFHVHCVS